MSETQTNAARLREINESIRYTMWSVFRLADVLGQDADRDAEGAEVEKLFAELGGADVVVRGVYDVSGLRADADVMVWWHSASSEALQAAYHRFRRTAFGARLAPVWSQMALHRPAEFNKSHVPAFLDGEDRAPARLRLPVRAVLRVVPAARRGAARHAQGARHAGASLPRRAGQHGRVVRARRLRVDPRLRGRRPLPHRRPDA